LYDSYAAYYAAFSPSGAFDSKDRFSGVCSKSCGSGLRTRYRKVLSFPQSGGADCPLLTDQVPCNTQACPQDCVVSGWNSYGSYDEYYNAVSPYGYYVDRYSYLGQCTVSCGGGHRHLYRYVISHAQYGGKDCPALSKSVVCSEQACPTNCVVSSWTDFDGVSYSVNTSAVDTISYYSSCTKSCGGGMRTQIRTVVRYPSANGIQCPELSRTVACNTLPCPIDALVGPWVSYDSYNAYYADWYNYVGFQTLDGFSGLCSASCGGGVRTLYRQIIRREANGGAPLPALTKTVPCNTDPCPGACVVSDWVVWEDFATYYASPEITHDAFQAQYFAQFDSAYLYKLGTCSKSCGTGKKLLFRHVVKPQLYGGAPCPELTKEITCNEQACPIDCVVSQWAYYDSYAQYYAIFHGYNYCVPSEAFRGLCSASCGSGVRTIYRYILTPDAHGGAVCPKLYKTVNCNTQDCPVDCVLSDWTNYAPTQAEYTVSGRCSVSCGGGTMKQFRKVLQYPSNGAACGDLTHRGDGGLDLIR
jgi:hypothetical protein